MVLSSKGGVGPRQKDVFLLSHRERTPPSILSVQRWRAHEGREPSLGAQQA